MVSVKPRVTHTPDDPVSTARGGLPFFVDLDNALMRSDLLWEAVVQLLFTRPWLVPLFPFWLLRGKARFKQSIFSRVRIAAGELSYNDGVLDVIREVRSEGRPVILATASPVLVAREIAAYLGVFDEVLGSSPANNLSGSRKLDAIWNMTDEGPFDYLGDSTADIPIFRRARQAVLVNPSARVRRSAERNANVVRTIQDRPPFRAVFFKSIRIHQWVKNLLLVIPLIVGHRISDAQALLGFVISFVAFGLMASSAYLINDLADLGADRKHPEKRQRPLAACAMSIPAGLGIAAVFIALSVAMSALMLPPPFLAWLGIYLFATLSYSFYFKRRLLVDVIVLSGLYTLRILAGGAAQNIHITEWLLGFSMFLFTSLAFAKRFTELKASDVGAGESINGRSYRGDDEDIIRVVGPTNGYLSVLVLALYINSPEVKLLYPHPQYLWLVCPLLVYWITRLWFFANRGELHQDPIVFALRDSKSYLTAGLGLGAVLAASVR